MLTGTYCATYPPDYIYGAASGLFALSAALMLAYGEADFARFKVTGPYQVGYKEFRTSELDHEVSVYYPISKECYDEKIKDSNIDWLRHGNDTLIGLAHVLNPKTQRDKLPMRKYKFLRDVKLDLPLDAEIHNDFT